MRSSQSSSNVGVHIPDGSSWANTDCFGNGARKTSSISAPRIFSPTTLLMSCPECTHVAAQYFADRTFYHKRSPANHRFSLCHFKNCSFLATFGTILSRVFSKVICDTLSRRRCSMSLVKGLHHMTVCVSGAQEDIDFQTQIFGQRMIKQTV